MKGRPAIADGIECDVIGLLLHGPVRGPARLGSNIYIYIYIYILELFLLW